jgi:hypothetical protein
MKSNNTANTVRKVSNTVINQYILDAINTENYEVVANTDKEKLQFLADTFKKEYVFPDNLKRYGSYQNVMREWIMGLPSAFNIDFENYRIIQIAKEWNMLDDNATERQEDKLIDGWFNFIAYKTMCLLNKHNIYSYML